MAVFLLNVSKVFGMAGIIAVAANTFAFLRFHRKRMASFENPIDESKALLASFPVDKDVDADGFFFAIATTAALLEKDEIPNISGKSEDAPLQNIEDSHLQEEVESGPQDGSQLNLFKSEIDLKAEDNGEQKLGEGAANDDKNGNKRRSASTVDVNELSESCQSKEGSTQNKSSNETSLDEWELLYLEKTTDKEHEPLDHVSGFPSVVGQGKLEVTDSSLDDQEDPDKMHGSIAEKSEKLDPTLEGLMKGLENVKNGQKELVSQTNVHCLKQKPSFWYNPVEELQLAKETNATVFRMNIEWSRIMPKEPIDGVEKAINQEALDQYRWFIERVRAHGLRVMLTLFHHSLPKWASAYGGWQEDKTVDYFLEYTRVVVGSFCDLVDYWITFNEPHVFGLTEYCSGIQGNLLQTVATVLSWGVFRNVINRMASAHLKAYDIIHVIREKTSRKVNVGISHHISYKQPYGLFDMSVVELSNWMTHFTYVDNVCSKLDFLGINYYGQEFISSFGLKLVKNEEYSEAGKSIYPDGLYRELLAFHNRYKKLNVPFIITENGVADATDNLRRPYILEHLLAVKAAMNKGVPVKGYCYCAFSDNMVPANDHNSLEFGLAAIDSENNLRRVPRPSYYLFSEVAKSGLITKGQREKAWAELQSAVMGENLRLICLGVDGQGGVASRVERPFGKKDWRFGHYKPDGLQDPVSCTLRCIWKVATLS
uniref:Beta-glucosidase n=1 Tax=Araucaria cunninghamii TaxID=56994 RepID=A0A0D6R109_ARACU